MTILTYTQQLLDMEDVFETLTNCTVAYKLYCKKLTQVERYYTAAE